LIAHYPNSLEYSTSPPSGGWCNRYIERYAIDSCEEQRNRIDTTHGVVWFVLAAWGSEKEWCGVEFGLHGFEEGDFVFTQHGPCCPSAPLEIPTSGWPGPSEGTAIVATSEPWRGDFVPVYYFVGYAYEEARIDIGVNPASNGLGTANCANPPAGWVPAAVGAMGLFGPGVYACPGEVPQGLQVLGAEPPLLEGGRVCCVGTGCTLTAGNICDFLSGVYHPEWTTCNPNPCSDQIEARYLVIGPGWWFGEDWSAGLEALATAHEADGIEGEVLTLMEIRSQYGSTDAPAIRQAIRDRFLDFGGPPTRFGVLLAGDWSSEPCDAERRVIPPFYRYDPLVA
jgi:hypothetical protein